jgi:hypothetical protein
MFALPRFCWIYGTGHHAPDESLKIAAAITFWALCETC